MHSLQSNHPASDSQRKGFALIATLLLMILLALLTVGSLSLSTVTIRSAQRGSAQAEARANARMALMIAIGELQKQMGPDQRISANANIFDDPETNANEVANPHWVGVWDSWIAGDLTEAEVNEDYPSAASHHQTIGSKPDAEMRPDYANKDNYFRRWLVSLDLSDASSADAAQSINLSAAEVPSRGSSAVRLVGENTTNSTNSNDYANAGLIDLRDGNNSITGRYGWWVGDESQKARIMDDSYETQTEDLTSAEKIYRSQAPASTGTETVSDLGTITDENELAFLASHQSLDLLSGLAANARPSKDNFHSITTSSLGVLADVREGGLKRDLNTLLERPIDINDTGDEFMLYKFDGDDERVPIQDLSAFYQLYRSSDNFSTGGRGGIKYTSSELSGKIQTSVPDYGASDDKYLREYTALYRNPVPVKVQFILGVGASEITTGQRAYANAWLTEQGRPTLGVSDKYKMSLGVKPVVSLWNPNNVPMVMDTNASQLMKVGFPPFVIRWKKFKAAGGEFVSNYVNLNYAITNESTGDGRARSLDPFIIKIQYAKSSPIIFEPGEIKTFTVDIPSNEWLENDGYSTYGDNATYDSKPFLPDGFYVTAKVAPPSSNAPLDIVKIEGDNGNTTIPTPNPNNGKSNWGYLGYRMIFSDGDKITVAAYPEVRDPGSGDWARLVARGNEVRGGGLQFFMQNKDAEEPQRNYQFISRFGQDGDRPNQQTTSDFNADLILAGFPEGEEIPFDSQGDAMPGASGEGNIKGFTDASSVKALMMFTMMPGAELNNSSTGGFSDGRKITTRPFLHGSTLTAPQIADNGPAALYDYGWEWQVEKINDTEEELQDDGSGRGYYGGGYAFGVGTTHVIQRYLPVLPPISIASLSSAHLGGYSLADNPVVGDDIKDAPALSDFRQTTATGQGGLAPHTLQAVGNAYAHPNLEPDKAFTEYTRELNTDVPLSDQEFTYVDHSYLANKALWDDFFFSSITPQFTDVNLQEAEENKSAFQVAREFLFPDEQEPGEDPIRLPNRRIAPFSENLNSDEFNLLESQYANFSDGFADKIASHLMLKGPFNINSTSVEAWKVLFSSLREKPVAYLNDAGEVFTESPPEETAVEPGIFLANSVISSGTITSDPAGPTDQWTSSRSLSNTEIEDLAVAMVKQVKERGPFLSLSEFINRRLDSTNVDLAVKGALQAALDDEDVSINEEFRTANRSLDSEAAALRARVPSFTPEFPEALDGPIAYGSTPYVDQADLLRQLGSTLTPRGDTYLIRTYGDSLDASGNVVARAWCEATVQRTPDYLDLSTDENHFSQERLTSETNKKYGRKFKITSFRWLSGEEI